MFNRLCATPRSVEPHHYRQRVEPLVRMLSPRSMVYVSIFRRDNEIEHLKCELHRAEAMGHILWRAHVDESVGPADLSFEVVLRTDRCPVRRRIAA
jgi:hypothetical protein